jgi:hypothetical protein
MTAFDERARRKASPELVKLLLDNNADATAVDGVPYSSLLLRLQ